MRNIAVCPQCRKPAPLCLCAEIRALDTRTAVLILQHPQEARNPINSAALLPVALAHCRLRVGLSWRSLSAAVGEKVEPKHWGVLYMGSLKEAKGKEGDEPFAIHDRKGAEVEPSSLEGIILLDGNWKQAKTLWWRNAWMLKLNRIVLNPSAPSRWRDIRRGPRKEALSTLEATALTLDGMGEDPAVSDGLMKIFEDYLTRVREHGPALTSD